MPNVHLLQNINADSKVIYRNPIMLWNLFVPLSNAIVLRFLFPPLADLFMERFDYDIWPHSWVIVCFLLSISSLLTGTVIGFLLLDQKDDNTFTSLKVTPLSMQAYMGYRTVLPVAINFGSNMLFFVVVGIVDVSFVEAAALSFLSSVIAPVVSLAMMVFAEDKNQGFAVNKFLNMLIGIPAMTFIYIDPTLWKVALAWIPSAWIVLVYEGIYERQAIPWGTMAIGVLYSLAIVVSLLAIHEYRDRRAH